MRIRLVFAGLFVFLALFFVLSLRRGPSGERQPTPMPLVLRQVQGLGELHTVKYTYQNVFEHQTSREPEQWTSYVPGLANVVTASTRNTALIGVTGTVEAGVNLASAKIEEGKLLLPSPKLYRPHVDAKLHNHRRGAFWNDPNIALKAVSATEERLERAAIEQGILVEAEKNAREQLIGLVPELARYEIVFG